MRRLITLLVLLLASVLSSCGGKFQLPTEHPGAAAIPSDGSYSFEGRWTEMDSVQDVLIQSDLGSQVFVLFNHSATTGPSVPRGEVRCYKTAIKKLDLTNTSQFASLRGLFNPVAIATAQRKLYVLDAGDSCMAKMDHTRGDSCDADPRPITADTLTRPHRNVIRDYSATWRVRQFPLAGGDTLSTFTDTTLVLVTGIAADDIGAVYVAGLAAIYIPNAADPLHPERTFVSRVFRYLPGPRYPGVVPNDRYMPGANWHRDTTWAVLDGAGTSSVVDPRGLAMSRLAVPRLLIADRGNNQGKTVSVNENGVGFAKFDGRETGSTFSGPQGVAADISGYLYVVDRGNRRVLRFDQYGGYVQQVNVAVNELDQILIDPVAIGVNDTLAYIADRGRSQVIRFVRRK